MVHFQQQQAHVHKTEYMNFPCDASSSPLSGSSMGAFLHKTHYWLAFPGGGTSLQQPEGPGTKKVAGKRYLPRFRQDRLNKICIKILLFLSKFTSWRLRLQASERVRSARHELCSSSQQSSATAPTISKAGNIISQDLVRLYKKVTIHFDNFPGNFQETSLSLHRTSDIRREQITRSSSDLDGNVYLWLCRSVIN